MTRIRRTVATAALAAAVTAGTLAAGAAAESTYRMTGKGTITTSDREPVTFRADLACPGETGGFDPQPDPPLEIELPAATFVLEKISSASCRLAEDGGRHEGTGTGTCAGRTATVTWSLTDGGDRDEARFEIRGETPECSVAAGGSLLEGDLELTDGREL